MAEGLVASYEQERKELWTELIALRIEFWDKGEYRICTEITAVLFLFWDYSNDDIRDFIDNLNS
jgi:hypothetical protein